MSDDAAFVALVLILFLACLMWCDEPDLHDALLEYARPQPCESKP
jgi:hypothetical protein